MARLTKYIGTRVGDGIVVRVRETATAVEFDVLDGGTITTHRIPREDTK